MPKYFLFISKLVFKQENKTQPITQLKQKKINKIERIKSEEDFMKLHIPWLL
mgnify:CR=1 FL=1